MIIMENTANNNRFYQPKTIAEMLPGLGGILSKSAIQAYSVKKQPRGSIQPRTAERVYKPLTIAEMRNDLRALISKSPRTVTQQPSTTKNKRWNSSIKLDNKTRSCISETKQNSVRKVLNFQPKPKVATLNKDTIIATETPKFPKPDFKPKKSHIQGKGIRISGVCGIPETPIVNNRKIPTNKMLNTNKENNPYVVNGKPKPHETPKMILKKFGAAITATPLSNLSLKSSSDASFLMNEREIDIEERAKVICDEPTLERIAEVSPPVSTPFKEYRSVEDFFNITGPNTSLQCPDNTIMLFDNVSVVKPSNTDGNESVNKANNREESAIISLCDLLNKASVTTSAKDKCLSTELEDLLLVKKQTEDNIKMIDSGILSLTNIKESQLKSLSYVQKLIDKKKSQDLLNVKIKAEGVSNDALCKNSLLVKVENNQEENLNQMRPSVIKARSPSYKIPKKNACLRKKVFYKSMPNVPNSLFTPLKETPNAAFNMYMQMKEQMNFLNTPVVKHRVEEPNTPSITSHNLKRQLDKLFNCS